jgi:hypothetical protein
MRAKSLGKRHAGRLAALALRACWVSAVAFAISVLPADSRAEQYEAGMWGGFGGKPFRLSCPDHRMVVVGVGVRSGTALDAIWPICASLNPERTEWGIAAYDTTNNKALETLPGLAAGGAGGTPKQLMCRRGDAVHVLTVMAGPWDRITVVKAVAIGCHDLDSANYYAVSLPALSTVSKEVTVSCPTGFWATGLYGQSGNLIDSVGILCDRVPPAVSRTLSAPTSTTTPPSTDPAIQAGCPGNYNYETGRCNKPVKDIGVGKKLKVTKEACEARGPDYLYIPQTERCIPPALQTALRAACVKKGVNYSYDPQTTQCVELQGGGQQAAAQNVCTVMKPGDVFSDCDGRGQKIGELAAGTQDVTLQEKCGASWYLLEWPAGEGWVYSGPGYDDALECPQ